MRTLKVIQRLVQRENGAALLVLALIGALVGVLIVTPLLGFSSTVLTGGNKLTKPEQFYARDSGIEDALRKVIYDLDFLGKVAAAAQNYPLTVNGTPVEVRVEKDSRFAQFGSPLRHYAKAEPVQFDATPEDHFVQYILTIENNTSREDFQLQRIQANLDSVVSYVDDSSNVAGNLTTDDPDINGTNLTWNFSSVTLPKFAMVTQKFTVKVPAGTSVGTYFISSTAKLPGLNLDTGSKAGPFTIVDPDHPKLSFKASVSPQFLDPGVEQEFLYTLEVTNEDTVNYDLQKIQFNTYCCETGGTFTYVDGSTGSDCSDPVLTADPISNASAPQPFGIQYVWIVHPGDPRTVEPGETRLHCFRVKARLFGGTYYAQFIVDTTGQAGANMGLGAPISVGTSLLITATANGLKSQALVTPFGPPGNTALIYFWEAN